MIYFIACIEANRVKIGLAAFDPWERFSSLSSACPFELQMLGFFEGDIKTERALHRRFDHLRIPRKGEWFHLTDEIRDYVHGLREHANRPPRPGIAWTSHDMQYVVAYANTSNPHDILYLSDDVQDLLTSDVTLAAHFTHQHEAIEAESNWRDKVGDRFIAYDKGEVCFLTPETVRNAILGKYVRLAQYTKP